MKSLLKSALIGLLLVNSFIAVSFASEDEDSSSGEETTISTDSTPSTMDESGSDE